MNEHSENEQFARLIVALEPWLTQMVIIGGWAHRLYRLHPSAQRIDYLPLTTLDTDIAVPARLKVIDKDVRERLTAYGFEEERLGEDQPPATHYRLGDANTGFYAEFLTPLFGSEHGRDGKPKATRRIAGGARHRNGNGARIGLCGRCLTAIIAVRRSYAQFSPGPCSRS